MKIRGAVVGTPIKPEKVLVKSENLTDEEKAIARANIGASATMLIVTSNEDSKASHSSAEIYNHVKSGGATAYVGNDGQYYMPIAIDSSVALFESVIVSDSIIAQDMVMVDNDYNTTINNEVFRVDLIEDETESTEKTWSSKKITSEITSEIKASASSVTIACKNAIAEAEEAGFKKAVETFCPKFLKSARLVQCYPLTDYPYSVSLWSTDDEALDGGVVVCGKNLYDKESYPLTKNQIIRHASGTYAYSDIFSATEKYIPCMHLQGQKISIRHAPRVTENNNSTGGGIAFYKKDQSYLSGANTSQVTVPDDASYMRFCINTKYAHEAQIELGDKSTEYEAYSEKQYSSSEGMDDEVELREGCNTIYTNSSNGEVRVLCREDISALVGKLRNYI